MKLKRTSVKVLLSASIILSMIPFSFKLVSAENSGWYWEIGPTTNGYVVNNCNFTFFNNQLTKGTWTLRIKQPTSGSAVFSFALIDTDGVTSVTRTYDANTRYYTVTINFDRCSYIHYLISVGGGTSDLWTVANLKNPQGQCDVSNTISITAIYNESYNEVSQLMYIKSILRDIQQNGVVVDTSGITAIMEDMIDNQELIIGLLEQQINGNQSTEDSIDDNTQTNEDLQTESSTYEQLESQFNDDFNDNLENVPTQTLEDHLQTWSTGVTWFRTQMDNIYNNLGEFRYIASIAIVLAIALIFIGR